jgi:hypothetical protein
MKEKKNKLLPVKYKSSFESEVCSRESRRGKESAFVLEAKKNFLFHLYLTFPEATWSRTNTITSLHSIPLSFFPYHHTYLHLFYLLM